MKLTVTLLTVLVLALAGIGEVSARSSYGSSRPYYGGGKHSESHGGQYRGGRGSSHKGGEYKNPRSGDQYGKHKP